MSKPTPPEKTSSSIVGETREVNNPETGETIMVPKSFLDPADAAPPDLGETAQNLMGTQLESLFPPQTVSPLGGMPQHEAFLASLGDERMALDDPQVLCMTCAHSQIMKSAAPVANRKPDGSRFGAMSGRCLVSIYSPMELEEARPVECTAYQKKEFANV